jgi:hypothetical protein
MYVYICDAHTKRKNIFFFFLMRGARVIYIYICHYSVFVLRTQGKDDAEPSGEADSKSGPGRVNAARQTQPPGVETRNSARR